MWGTEFQHDTYFGHFSLNKMEFSCIFVGNRVVKLRCRIVGIFFIMMWCQRQIRKFFKGGGWKTMYQPHRLLSQMHTMNYTRILQGNIVTYWKHAEVSRGGRPLLPWIRHCFHYYSVFCYCQTVGSFSVNNETSFFCFSPKKLESFPLPVLFLSTPAEFISVPTRLCCLISCA